MHRTKARVQKHVHKNSLQRLEKRKMSRGRLYASKCLEKEKINEKVTMTSTWLIVGPLQNVFCCLLHLICTGILFAPQRMLSFDAACCHFDKNVAHNTEPPIKSTYERESAGIVSRRRTLAGHMLSRKQRRSGSQPSRCTSAKQLCCTSPGTKKSLLNCPTCSSPL